MKRCSECNEEKESVNFCKDVQKGDGLTSKCKKCIQAYYNIKKLSLDFIDKKRENGRKSQRKRRLSAEVIEKQNVYRRNRYHNDEVYRKKVIRQSVKFGTNRRKTDPSARAIGNARNRLRSFFSLIGKSKINSYSESLGCTRIQLKTHLESKFQEGMTWDNYGKWHIDHIHPLSTAYKQGEDQFKKACHYTNLQPLWALDNIRKGNKSQS